MNKKEMKFYETPACEVMEIQLDCQVLTASGGSNADNVDSEEPEWD